MKRHSLFDRCQFNTFLFLGFMILSGCASPVHVAVDIAKPLERQATFHILPAYSNQFLANELAFNKAILTEKFSSIGWRLTSLDRADYWIVLDYDIRHQNGVVSPLLAERRKAINERLGEQLEAGQQPVIDSDKTIPVIHILFEDNNLSLENSATTSLIYINRGDLTSNRSELVFRFDADLMLTEPYDPDLYWNYNDMRYSYTQASQTRYEPVIKDNNNRDQLAIKSRQRTSHQHSLSVSESFRFTRYMAITILDGRRARSRTDFSRVLFHATAQSTGFEWNITKVLPILAAKVIEEMQLLQRSY